MVDVGIREGNGSWFVFGLYDFNFMDFFDIFKEDKGF